MAPKKSLVLDNKQIKPLLEANYAYNDYFRQLANQENKSVKPPELPDLTPQTLGRLLMSVVPDKFGTIADLRYINNAAKAGFALIKLKKTTPLWAVGRIRETQSDSGY